MRAAKPLALVAFALAGLASTSLTVADGSFGGALDLVSDSIYRGISQTCGAPAAQADVHFRSAAGQAVSESFVGLWGSAGLGDSPCRRAQEVNVYAGHTFETGQDSNTTLTYTHFAYPGNGGALARQGTRYAYDELGASWAFRDELYLTVGFTPDAAQYQSYGVERNRRALFYGVQWHRPLIAALTVSAGLGYDEILDPTGTGYGFWNAGLGYTLAAFEFGLVYVRTAGRAERLFGPEVAGGRVAATALWRF
ncbi:MAG TPA: TorF family putative porin [Steroidobacteraceae bacterium]